jgi:predicted TIM-barrel fold metal-dependent hydrolase
MLGLDRGVIVHSSSHRTDNSVTLDAISRMNGRCLGVAIIDPSIADRELERLHASGMRGIRISTMLKSAMGVADIERMAPRLQPFGWNVELHFNTPDELLPLLPMLRRLPIDVVFDHMGRVRGKQGMSHPAFQALLRLIAESDRFWVKVCSWYRLSDSGPPYDDMRPVIEALVATRADRLLWGSNWPHPQWDLPVPDDADLLDQFQTWAGDARRQILVDNPARLYGFRAA